MASPQAEDGYTRIANEIIEALARMHLSGRQTQIMWVVFRLTYGYQRKEATISFDLFEEMTGCQDRRHLATDIRALEARGMLIIQHHPTGNRYAFQKDYERWDNPLSIAENSNTHSDASIADFGNGSIAENSNGSIAENSNGSIADFGTHERKKEREKNMPRASSDFLPEADLQAGLLLAGRGNGNHRDGRKELARVGWTLPSPDLEAACSAFVAASDIIPPRAKGARRDWLAALSEHVEEYGVIALRELYPLAVAKLRGGKLTVSRPGSLTKTLPAVAQELARPGQNGGYRL